MTTIREHYSVLIPHPTAPRAWLVPRADGWVLPEFVPEREIHNLDLPHARRMVEAQLGVDGSALYALRLFEPALPSPLNLYVLEQAGQLGFTATGAAERLRSAYTSEIVRLPAEPADLYLKAMPAPLAHEGAALARLAERHPAFVPAVLASDPRRRWVLAPDMGGRSLSSEVPVERWELSGGVRGALWNLYQRIICDADL